MDKSKLQLRDRRVCRNSSLQAVCDTPIARITGCVSPLIEDVGRRLSLQLQCSFQSQQGDVSQSMRANLITRDKV